MSSGERRITSLGFEYRETATGAEWEAHASLDNDEYIDATGASKQQALENLVSKAAGAGLAQQIEAFQAMFPHNVPEESDDWTRFPDELEPPSTAYTCQYRLDRETNEHITLMRI